MLKLSISMRVLAGAHYFHGKRSFRSRSFRSRSFRSRGGHLDPGHLDPGHLDPGHLDPGHLDPRTFGTETHLQLLSVVICRYIP